MERPSSGKVARPELQETRTTWTKVGSWDSSSKSQLGCLKLTRRKFTSQGSLWPNCRDLEFQTKKFKFGNAFAFLKPDFLPERGLY